MKHPPLSSPQPSPACAASHPPAHSSHSQTNCWVRGIWTFFACGPVWEIGFKLLWEHYEGNQGPPEGQGIQEEVRRQSSLLEDLKMKCNFTPSSESGV